MFERFGILIVLAGAAGGCSEVNIRALGDHDVGGDSGGTLPPGAEGGPLLEISPSSYVFDGSVVSCGDTAVVHLKNVGQEPLVITEIDYSSYGALSIDTDLIDSVLPFTLPPGESQGIVVTLAPTPNGADTGVLTVVSNDPRGPISADQNAEGQSGEWQTESFTAPSVSAIDVMLLIDQSCSMSDNNLGDVRRGLPGFLQQLQQIPDWHLIEINEDLGCAVGGVMDEDTPDAEQLLVDNAFSSSPIIINNRTEKLLELASIALDKTDPGECNDGFLRPGALLDIVVLSDEEEQSNQPYTHWLGEYVAHTGSSDLVKVSAIVDVNNLCGEGTGPRGYLEAAQATGGPVLDICTPQWGDQMSGLAAEVVEGIRSYVLSSTPEPGSVTVSVNGAPTTAFSVVGRTVTVSEPLVGDGDVVEIGYRIGSECP